MGQRGKGVYRSRKAYKRKNPYTRFVLVGGSDNGNPESIPKEYILKNKNVGIIDWNDHTDHVKQYIEDSDVVVLLSYREGLPRSLLEGASMSWPLIATDVLGCRQVVEDGITGLLVKP